MLFDDKGVGVFLRGSLFDDKDGIAVGGVEDGGSRDDEGVVGGVEGEFDIDEHAVAQGVVGIRDGGFDGDGA